jgi:hypothetical protein
MRQLIFVTALFLIGASFGKAFGQSVVDASTNKTGDIIISSDSFLYASSISQPI